MPIAYYLFRELSEGDSFDFISPDAMTNSFYLRCVKTGKRTYRDSTNVVHTVGRVTCKVYHVEHVLTPIKLR